MSFYRTSDRYPRSDVHVHDAGNERMALATRRGTAPINVDLAQYEHLRKATPIEKPLLRTLTWVAALPHHVQPHALVRRYARIANLIAAAWGDPKCFHAYMESLLTDKRGNRRGFPPDVLTDLQGLQRYYDIPDQSAAWDGVSKRG